MKRTTIFLTELQAKQLADESNRTGLAVAELIRRSIDWYLDRPYLRQLDIDVEEAIKRSDKVMAKKMEPGK